MEFWHLVILSEKLGKNQELKLAEAWGLLGQMGPCEKDADCDEGNVCNLLSGSCEEGIEVGTNTNTGEKLKFQKAKQEEKIH